MDGGMAALPYDMVTAGRGQLKQTKKKEGNNQPDVQLHGWWHGGTAMRHRRSRKQAVQSGNDSKKEGKR